MDSFGLTLKTRFWTFAMLLLLVLYSEQATGTHLVGGELTYEYVGLNAQGDNEFEVHCYIYLDCSSNNSNGTGFDASAVIGVYQQNNLITTASGSLNPALVI